MKQAARQSGFSLIEVMITLAILMVVSAIVLSMGYMMTMRQASVANRSDMHSNVRSVTQLLQQEISQAGKVGWPTDVAALCGGAASCEYPWTTMSTAVTTANACTTFGDAVEVTVTIDNSEYLFDGIRLTVDRGECQETIAFNDPDGDGTGTAYFVYNHAADAVVRPAGAFGNGILPESTGSKLRMFGDINDDGNLVYVEYECVQGQLSAPGTLTRREVPWDATAAELDAATPVILLNNVICNDNPEADLPCDDTVIPCFEGPDAQVQTIDTLGVPDETFNFMLNINVTLTTRAEAPDQQTGAWQFQKKALLNVSPRNVFQAWQLASNMGTEKAIQPTPSTVETLALVP